ncbi:MAG: hypothetical protein NVSMB5_16980 [Candidatus Velthaea sp.]
MNDTIGRNEFLFVVRIWSEPSQAKSDGWRGSVYDVPASQRLYFSTLADLHDFITLRLAHIGAPKDS